MRPPVFRALVLIAGLATLGALRVATLPHALAEAKARLDCTVTENGKPASASFRALDGEKIVASSFCGKPADVPAGSYALAIVLDGAVDSPELRQQVTVRAGQTALGQASFETGELVVEM